MRNRRLITPKYARIVVRISEREGISLERAARLYQKAKLLRVSPAKGLVARIERREFLRKRLPDTVESARLVFETLADEPTRKAWNTKSLYPDSRRGVWYARREIPGGRGPGEILVVYLAGQASGWDTNDFEISERRPV